MTPTVLIVEDQTSLRLMISLALELLGYRVITAENGVEAIAQLSDRHVDLILTDWLMPEMGGEEFLQNTRRQRAAADLPAIVMSCIDRPLDSQTQNSLGIRSWLRKPCRVSDIQNAVEDLVKPNSMSQVC